MPNPRYFDYASTSPIDPRVLAEMMPFLTDDFGNANSLHGFGQKAAVAVELARQRVAALIDAEDPTQILFTSGATEANNWVLNLHPDAAVSPFEHSSIDEYASKGGLRRLANDQSALLSWKGDSTLICLMAVNNETGHIWNPEEIRGDALKVHSDATQIVGKLPFAVENLDYISLSAHKFYGPKGVGALYARELPRSPYMFGGEQEFGLRGGTLNVPGIVGMGAACAIATDEMHRNETLAKIHRQTLIEGLQGLTDFLILSPENGSPFILSLSCLGVQGETLAIELDRHGYAVSSGAACSSRSSEPSHVLTAMGFDKEWVRGALRISLGTGVTQESVAALAYSLLQIVEKLRTM